MEQKLHDIYDTWHVPFWQHAWFYWTMVFAMLCLLACILGSIIYLYRARKKEIPLDPWDEALRALYALRDKKVVTIEQGSRTYAELTQILKHYLYQRYGFDVVSKTDDEVIALLEHTHLDSVLLADIRDVFQGSVYIKFAHVQVMQERTAADLERSIAFVQATRPVSH